MNLDPSERFAVVDMLVEALNAHDLDALVECFAEDYSNVTPAHPMRGFRGGDQVRRNWSRILGGVPDIRAEILRRASDGAVLWTEWEMAGTRRDGERFLMRGVVIFEVADGLIGSSRFYLEPVEEATGDVDVHTRRVVGEAIS